MEGARWFFIAGILAYEAGTYEYHVEKQGWILKQLFSVVIKLVINGDFEWADLIREHVDGFHTDQELKCFDLLTAFISRFLHGPASEEDYSKLEEDVFLAAASEIKVFQGPT